MGETSAATAACAGLAGRLLARYPNLRMETVRALMVHAAEWTPAMKAQFDAARNSGLRRSEAYARLIGRFGWGVPNETRLFESARNALTLMVEDTLEPYRRGDDSGLPLKEMKYSSFPGRRTPCAPWGPARSRCGARSRTSSSRTSMRWPGTAWNGIPPIASATT